MPSGGSRVSTAAVSGCSSARANSATGPSNIQNVTNMPTARNATSLTIDSVAIASIRPSWCSVASMWRVPNSTAKAAIEQRDEQRDVAEHRLHRAARRRDMREDRARATTTPL